MEKANVGIIEDDPGHISLLECVLPLDGHNIEAKATNLPDALGLIDKLAEGEVTCDVLVIDGNLHSQASDTSDAEKVIDRIKQRCVVAKTIGYSCCSRFTDCVSVDYYAGKDVTRVQEALRDM